MDRKEAIKFGCFVKQLPFEFFMRTLFPIVSKSPYTKEDYHDKIFNYFHNVYNMNDDYRYCNLNLCPRSGKTLNSYWFMFYSIVNNPCEFIYTSFSSAVLKDVLEGFRAIYENPIINIMFGSSFGVEDIEDEWIDPELQELYEENNKESGKALFTSKRITVGSSVIHLVPTGSSPTGIGFGRRNSKTFSGMLLMDDFQKPIEVKNSELMRNKTNSFFPTALVSRGNGTHAMGNIMQRICVGDFTEFLEDEYDFKTIKAPLIVDGKCQLPSQYDEKLLKLIKSSESDFMAQYQQEPIEAGGNLFKEEWFEWTYDIPSLSKFESIFFTVDTAFSDKENADFTSIMCFGILDKKLYLIDMILDRINSIELPKIIDSFCSKYRSYNMRELWIEQKASGITIQQALRRFSQNVKLAKEKDMKEHMKRITNKVERANDVIGWIDEEIKNVIINKNLPNFGEFKNQLVSFPNGNHDDSIDTMIDGIRLYSNYYMNSKADYQTALSVRKSMGM